MRQTPSCQLPLILFFAGITACATSFAGPTQAVMPAILAGPLPLAEANTARGEFEGRYEVGNTYCTVSPGRMVFNVRWAEDEHSVRFFYFTPTANEKVGFFASEGADKGTDMNTGKGGGKFVFDDERYDSGQFFEAGKDGKLTTFGVGVKRLGGGANGR